ncbi:MAG: hypothetical protein N3E40_03910, partial [Dehalococcoidia bacterium]|nr:hypothetical protein [Dehalococcoidia bacterium]
MKGSCLRAFPVYPSGLKAIEAIRSIGGRSAPRVFGICVAVGLWWVDSRLPAMVRSRLESGQRAAGPLQLDQLCCVHVLQGQDLFD